ncbi:hypothetical protein SAMN05877831_11733 [Rhodobacter maris]|uniref:Uncharacterized protein n=1 Tax=Rhodobacter maris TaxID=446682 RepID=A0A285TBC8_9RHOB|nr:hypothetical protein SAMN05877831_11733 [Rhodobacter maris]
MGRAVIRKKRRRDQGLAFFAKLLPCVVAMEACGRATSGAVRSASAMSRSPDGARNGTARIVWALLALL